MSTKTSDYANVFAPVFEQAAETATNEKNAMQERIEALQTQRDDFDRQIESVKQQMESLDEAIRIGLTHAAREAGLKFSLNGNGNGNAAGARKGGADKISNEHTSQVLAAVPEGRRDALTFGGICKAVDISDGTVVSAALKRLISDKKINTLGERRAKRYFR